MVRVNLLSEVCACQETGLGNGNNYYCTEISNMKVVGDNEYEGWSLSLTDTEHQQQHIGCFYLERNHPLIVFLLITTTTLSTISFDINNIKNSNGFQGIRVYNNISSDLNRGCSELATLVQSRWPVCDNNITVNISNTGNYYSVMGYLNNDKLFEMNHLEELIECRGKSLVEISTVYD